MTPTLQILIQILVLSVATQYSLSVPVSRKPQSVSVFSPAATYNVNPMLQSRALSNARFASALYGGVGAYPLGSPAYSSYNSGYGGRLSPVHNGFGGYQPAHTTSSFENYQTGHPLLGHATTSRKNSQYVTNNYGFPALGNSYEHSTNVYGGMGAVYPGVYVPIGAKYGSYGNYDHFGFGGHGSYQVTPHYTKVTHTQTIPNYGVNKLRGYGK